MKRRRSSGSHPKPWATRLRYAVFLLVTVVLGLEILLRLFDPLGIEYLFEIHRYSKTMHQADPRFAYISKPHAEELFQGVEVRINAHGFRGPDFAAAKPAGVRRLLVLGDSIVFGWGVPQERIFPTLLQMRLDEQGAATEVIAAGVNSWNTRTQYEFLKHVGADYEPDVLLLVVTHNDIDPKREGPSEVSREQLFADKSGRSWIGNLSEDVWRFITRRSYAATHLQYFWRRRAPPGGELPAAVEEARWRDARLALDGIIALCRERGIELMIALYGSAETAARDAALSRYLRHLQALGLPPDTVPAALLEDPALRNSFVDRHINARGHEILAAALLEALAPRLAQIGPAE